MRANDEKSGKTYTYSYSNGNITEQKEYTYTTGELGEAVDTKTWLYGNSTWSDLLTSYNGEQIVYDEIGNPLTIGNKELTWLGRQLLGITEGESTVSYTYNGDGQRISKTVNGVNTEYIYNGSILAGQKTGNDIIVFMYDNNSDAFGFIYNSTEYYYIKNAQNDVTAIADSNGNVLARYYYDAWGKVLEITGNTEIAGLNPIRYRSYYYDAETGWYYLNTRYYSADMCRFINEDEYVQTGQGVLDKNMFAYCCNNSVNNTDHFGTCYYNANGQWCHDNWEYLGGYKRKPEPIELTEKLDTAMKENSALLSEYSRTHNSVSTTAFFVNKVKPGGEWDLKNQDDWALDPNTIYSYNKIVLRDDDIGNIHYGYVGRTIFSERMLLIAGGVVQIYTGHSDWSYIDSNLDDPRDQWAIQTGFYQWDKENCYE